MDDWPSWAFKLKSWFGAQFQKGEQVLDWAQRQNDMSRAPIDPMIVQYPAAPKMNTQLRVILISVSDTDSEALAIVKKSNRTIGLDAG